MFPNLNLAVEQFKMLNPVGLTGSGSIGSRQEERRESRCGQWASLFSSSCLLFSSSLSQTNILWTCICLGGYVSIFVFDKLNCADCSGQEESLERHCAGATKAAAGWLLSSKHQQYLNKTSSLTISTKTFALYQTIHSIKNMFSNPSPGKGFRMRECLYSTKTPPSLRRKGWVSQYLPRLSGIKLIQMPLLSQYNHVWVLGPDTPGKTFLRADVFRAKSWPTRLLCIFKPCSVTHQQPTIQCRDRSCVCTWMQVSTFNSKRSRSGTCSTSLVLAHRRKDSSRVFALTTIQALFNCTADFRNRDCPTYF